MGVHLQIPFERCRVHSRTRSRTYINLKIAKMNCGDLKTCEHSNIYTYVHTYIENSFKNTKTRFKEPRNIKHLVNNIKSGF